jgi:purine-cytosine permease-like protein
MVGLILDNLLFQLDWNDSTCIHGYIWSQDGTSRNDDPSVSHLLTQYLTIRFSFGWYGAVVLAAANVIACMGWSMVNSIVGGQVIAELSDGKCPLVVGVILIALVSLIVALLGYKFVHHFERFSWIVMIILFCIVAGLGAKHFVNLPMGVGQAESASVLSFGGAVFGFSVAWISLTADYNVNMRAEIPRWKVFSWTYLGLFCSLNFIEWLGILPSLSNEQGLT